MGTKNSTDESIDGTTEPTDYGTVSVGAIQTKALEAVDLEVERKGGQVYLKARSENLFVSVKFILSLAEAEELGRELVVVGGGQYNP